MSGKPAAWKELASGIKALRLYKTDLDSGGPEVVILQLSAEKFLEFERDPLAFDKQYQLCSPNPIKWISHCAHPPHGNDIPLATQTSSWTVVIPHHPGSMAGCAACPWDVEGGKPAT